MTDQLIFSNTIDIDEFDHPNDENVNIPSDPILDFEVHIRVQQRNARQRITTIAGIPKVVDHKRILKFMKKNLSCNGSTVKHEEHGTIIQLQGDHRESVSKILISQGICDKKQVHIHGV